jgi:hypothetical protein
MSGRTIMRAPHYGLATALALSTWISGTSALAAEPGPDTLPIQVIAVQTPDADDQAEALTNALRVAMRATPGWSLGEGDYSLEVLTLSLKCADPPDASCQSRIADQIRADRYIWGVLEKGKNKNVVGELNLWVRGKGTAKVQVDYSANLTEPQDEALQKVAKDSIEKLTGGPPKGELKVKAGNVDGQVFIDGQPVGALTAGQGSFFVPSGTHQLVVKAPGYSEVSTSVTVRPNASTDATVSLLASTEKTPTNWKRIGGFVGIGAGVALAAVGVVGTAKIVGLNGDQKFTDAKAQYPKGQNICDGVNGNGNATGILDPTHVQTTCDSGKTFELLQGIFYPLAGIAAGAGIFLLATSGSSDPNKTGLIIRPTFGKSGGKLDVGFAF